MGEDIDDAILYAGPFARHAGKARRATGRYSTDNLLTEALVTHAC